LKNTSDRWENIGLRMIVSQASFTFSQQLLLNLAGPIVTVALGGGLITYLLYRIKDRREEEIRRDREWREDQARRDQTRRQDHGLRERLVREVVQTPTALYVASQHYWRAKRDKLPPEQLAEVRRTLDAQYSESVSTVIALEYLLGLHRVGDLLTVRYFQLVTKGGASPALRQKNAGDDHTGLDASELAHAPRVLDKYHKTLGELAQAVSSLELIVTPGSVHLPDDAASR
jgi:hypothetical protein